MTVVLPDVSGLTATVEIDGQPVPVEPPVAECTHDSNLMVDTLVGFVKDDDGSTLDWQLRVRVICGLCSAPFSIASHGRLPADGGPGTVLTMRPIDRPALELPPCG
jgi:hypothetical protein